MRSLTTLEAQFLNRLKEAIHNRMPDSLVERAFVTQPQSKGPSLQVALQMAGHPLLVYFDVLIYGTRPVRYHLETAADDQGKLCRGFWNRLLGALNLVVPKSGERSGRLHLFYEVRYPDKELKKLGEK